jgi:RHS repeat-associated protein
MPGRKYSVGGSGYRYGFNGKENDKDAGEGIQDYGMRIYDSRLGRFLSVDPYTKKTPNITPYLFANNSPLINIDFKGGFAIFWHYLITKRALLKLGVSNEVAKLVSHYASVFADNPLPSEGKFMTVFIMNVNESGAIFNGISGYEAHQYVNYRKDVSYEATKNSQSMTDKGANIQHATRMASEVGSVSADKRVCLG